MLAEAERHAGRAAA